jgi:hypothetical protein
MDSTHIAAVDRRVHIIDGSNDQKSSIQRISQLRDVPYLVLLGEPGSGKSTVLESEARREGVEAVKVRALLQGGTTQPGTLFLDALDEYRSDGSAKDKTHQLAAAIQASGAQGWWLTCRAEDWRKEADIHAIRGTTQGQPIVVAQLLPLNYWEAAEVLTAFGESDPQAFLDRAESLGADAFTQNPLSLRLLRAAVAAEGRWPRTRFELFESAVWRLAHEDNIERRDDLRPVPNDLVAAADTANLMYLVTGARALWRSNALPPDLAVGRSAYLAAHDLGVARDRIDAALDTPLFRGEGEAFEPMHRTIAEFTAARALARAVRGGPGHAAFPLSRALALITAPDGGPPTELRGLFAWFAAHLAKQGNRAGALRLIEADAPTVMSYGDAASFEVECRRAIFHNLNKHTPYFRSQERGDTAAGGLAGEDLADDFAAVLRAPLDGTQRTYTVLDVLTTGAPVLSLKPLLREIALDPARPDWVRRRAVEAWLNGLPDVARERRQLFDALAAEPISVAREDVRLELVRGMLDPALSTEDVRLLISAFRESGRSHTIGRSIWLKNELKQRPRPDLFETPIKDWLRENSGQDYQHEIDDLLDEALSAVILAHQNLMPSQLWRWIMNAAFWGFPHLGEKSQKAVREWLNSDVGHELEFLLTIQQGLVPDDGPWKQVFFFSEVTKRLPSPEVVRRLLSRAEADAEQSHALLELAFRCIDNVIVDADLYWQVYERLSREPEMASQAEKMRVHEILPWRLEEMERKAERDKRKYEKKTKDVAELTPLISEIAQAERPSVLQAGAEIYYKKTGNNQDESLPGLSAIINAFNPEIAEAIIAGWRRILTIDFAWPSVEDLAKIEVEHNHYYVEYAVLAAIDICIELNDFASLSDAPLEIAISVLRKADRIRFDIKRERLIAWAIEHLCRDAQATAVFLCRFWGVALDAGATYLSLLSTLMRADDAKPILQQVLPRLLREHPMMPVSALRQVLLAAATLQMPAQLLHDLADQALSNPAVKDKPRRLWAYVDFALNPEKFDVPDAALPSPRTILATFDQAIESDDLINAFDPQDDARVLRRALMVAALGRVVSPSADYPSASHRRRGSREGVVRESINILGAIVHPAAGEWLTRLIAQPDLAAWYSQLRHARFEQARLMRDHAFVHPAPGAVREALAGRAPVNSADLRAIVREELLHLRSELRTSADSPWRHYWDNIGKRGKIPTPKIENVCRNYLIVRLRDRMQPYGIACVAPEHQHAEETRSDITLLSHAGKTFPVEVKRDSNAELWTAAATQLQGYANADTADGSGLYLVFWFNHPDSPMPARPDGQPKPTSADALAAMLVNDLPEELRTRVDVIVFDVSDRDAKFDPAPKKKARTPRKKAAS